MILTDEIRARLLHAMDDSMFAESTRYRDIGIEDEIIAISNGEAKGDQVQMVLFMLDKYGLDLIGYAIEPWGDPRNPALMVSDGYTEGWISIPRQLFVSMQRRAARKHPEEGDGIDWVPVRRGRR